LLVSLVAHAELLALGLEEHLRCYLGPQVQLTLDETATGQPALLITAKRSDLDEHLVERFSLVRRESLSLPFLVAIKAQESGTKSALMRIPLRRTRESSSDAMFIQGHADRVTVVLATSFEDPSDMTLGKVFMQARFIFFTNQLDGLCRSFTICGVRTTVFRVHPQSC